MKRGMEPFLVLNRTISSKSDIFFLNVLFSTQPYIPKLTACYMLSLDLIMLNV